MSIAVYLRVSTMHQAQAQTIEQQLTRLTAHIKAQGGVLTPEYIFRDDGYSGATLKRPGLDCLRDHVSAGRVARLFITEPDRLARKYVHQVLLMEELERGSCQVEFLDRPMSQDPHDQLLLQIRGAVAEYERTLIAERMRRGREAKLRAGLLLPWTRAPYAYRLDPDRPRDPALVRVDEAEAAVVQQIYEWYASPEGRSLLGLVRHLRAQQIPSPTGKAQWGIATLRGILTNPAYTGQVYAGRMRYRAPRIRRSSLHPIGRPHDTGMAVAREEWIAVAPIPAIVTAGQYEVAQMKLARNQSFAKRNNKTNDYLLRALVSCGRCRLACLARRVQPNHRYYICSGKAKADLRHRAERCSSRFIPAPQLDDLVWNDLCELMRQPEHLAQSLRRAHAGQWLPQELQARRETLHKGRAGLAQQLERLTEAYLSGVIPLVEYQRRRGECERRQQVLDQQAQQLHQQVTEQSEIGKLVASVEEFRQRVAQGLTTATFEQKRQLVELLIDRVVVTDSDVEIRYVLPTAPASEHVRFCHLRSDYIR